MKQLRNKGRIWGVSFLMIMVALGCYENQEGCLEILADNYDVTADVECLDCCTYPDLVMVLTQTNDGESFSLGDTIVNNLGIETIIIDMVYLLSSFSVEIDGVAVSVADSMQVVTDMDTISINDDAIAVSRTKGSYIIGEMKDRGQISEISFEVGLPAIINGNALIVEAANDLTRNTDTLRADDNSYVVQRLVLGVGADLTDTLTIEVGAEFGGTLATVPLDTTFALGTDKRIALTVDYSGWFDEVNFETTDTEIIQQALVDNLARSFSY